MDLSKNRENLYSTIDFILQEYSKNYEEYKEFYAEWKRSFPNVTTFVSHYFKDLKNVIFLFHLCNDINVYDNPIKFETFFMPNFACDLPQFSITQYCKPQTPSPVNPTPSPVNPTPSPVNPTPSPVNPTPSPSDQDTSANSPDKTTNPGGGGKLFNIPGDPYKWRIGDDGGWWAKKDDQNDWNNISGQVNSGKKPNWKISIDRMDNEFFDGDVKKRVSSKNLAEAENIELKLGKFFLD